MKPRVFVVCLSIVTPVFLPSLLPSIVFFFSLLLLILSLRPSLDLPYCLSLSFSFAPLLPKVSPRLSSWSLGSGFNPFLALPHIFLFLSLLIIFLKADSSVMVSPISSLIFIGGLFTTVAQAGISTFQITQPSQCSPMNITWVPSGSIVSTEFNLILIPTTDDSQVLSNISFTATGNSYTLPALPLAKNVEFIAMLQDRTDGASQGRVSQIVQTSDSDGAGTDCLANLPHYLDFVFSIEFENGTSYPTQCATTTVYDWNNATAPIGISGLIPGGESFNVPITDITNQRADWTTAIPAGTNVMFIMSDGGSRGSGGSTGIYTVAAGSSSCFKAGTEIYSSLPIGDVPTTQTVTTTVTAPAGNPSSSSSSTTSNASRKTSHVGAIAGGVVGGLAGLAILAGLFVWLFKRREKKNQTEKEEMMGVARPWSPPVPEDPENVRTSTYLSGAGVGAGGALGGHSDRTGGISSPQFGRQNESYETTPQAQYQLTPLSSPFGNGTYPPSSFSHIPPGSVGANTTVASTDSLSESRRSTEKRAFTFGGPSGNRLSGGYRGIPTAGSDGEDEGAQEGGNIRGEEPLSTRAEGLFDHERNQSQTRFVRHEDAGLIEGAHGDIPNDDEVVDLPPLYQDAGKNQVGTRSVARDQATANNSGSKSGLR